MPFAITLRLDPVSAAAVEEMWRTLADAGIDADCRDLGYVPHITLAVYPDDSPPDLLGNSLRLIAADRPAFPVTLSGIGIFPGRSSIVWAAPVVTPALLAWQAAILHALPDLAIHPHYRTDAWVPHVTLSGAVTDPGRAVSALSGGWRPVSGHLQQADLVRFRPVEVLRSYMLNQ